MASNLQLFDDVGNHWDGLTGRLENSFGSTATPDDFSTYVVKNMGFIAVHCYGRSCEIRLRPNLVSAATFDTMKAWTSERRFDRVVTVCFKDDDWDYGLHIRQADALAKLDAMITAARGPRPGDYLVRHITKEDLPRTTPLHRALHSLIENWPMLSQSVHRDGLSNIIERSLQGRYTVVSVDNSDRLLFSEFGHGFMSYSKDWAQRTVGRPVEALDDEPYGRWAATGYREALKTGVPTICDVDAIMHAPTIGRARVRYKRILFPAKAMEGSWLLTSSILDQTIDLRAELLAKAS